MNDTTPWRVLFHRVSTPDRQQRVLAAIVHVDRPGLRALGTSNGGERYVAVECRSVADELVAHRIVRAVDAASRPVRARGRCEGLALAVRDRDPAGEA